MRKVLYRTPVRKKKEWLFYMVTFGSRKDVSLVIKSERAEYYPIKTQLEVMLQRGDFAPVFTEGRVFIERISRIDKDSPDIDSHVKQIKRSFNAISINDIEEIKQSKEKPDLSKFFTPDCTEEFSGLQKVVLMENETFEAHFLRVMQIRFPELVKNHKREHKQLSREFEIM